MREKAEEELTELRDRPNGVCELVRALRLVVDKLEA